MKTWSRSNRSAAGELNLAHRVGEGFIEEEIAFFLNTVFYPLTAAVSFMVCEHLPTPPTPHQHRSVYLNTPGGCPKAAIFSLSVYRDHVTWPALWYKAPQHLLIHMSAHCMGSELPGVQSAEQKPTGIALWSNWGYAAGFLNSQVEHESQRNSTVLPGQGGFCQEDNSQKVRSHSYMILSCTKPYDVHRALFDLILHYPVEALTPSRSSGPYA